MSFVMFLDDIRDPHWVYPDQNTSEWVVCRSYHAAVAVIQQQGWPDIISFDHDLGDAHNHTGCDLAHYLINQDLDAGGQLWPHNFEYRVHSANVVGAANIRNLLDAYVRQRG